MFQPRTFRSSWCGAQLSTGPTLLFTFREQHP
jgi:hypothetical protein